MIKLVSRAFRKLITPYRPIDWVWKLMIFVIGLPFYLIGMNVASEYNVLQRQLSQMALTDLLTGLDNRRAFFEKVAGKDGTILMMDVDRFKKVNDTFGHDVGDLALQAVAEHLRACVRSGDRVARLGGEEFAVLLQDVGQEQALEIGKRITQGVQVEPVGSVTPSVGGVVPDDWDGDLKTAIRRADMALYTAKHSGRTRIVMWSPDVPVPDEWVAQSA